MTEESCLCPECNTFMVCCSPARSHTHWAYSTSHAIQLLSRRRRINGLLQCTVHELRSAGHRREAVEGHTATGWTVERNIVAARAIIRLAQATACRGGGVRVVGFCRCGTWHSVHFSTLVRALHNQELVSNAASCSECPLQGFPCPPPPPRAMSARTPPPPRRQLRSNARCTGNSVRGGGSPDLPSPVLACVRYGCLCHLHMSMQALRGPCLPDQVGGASSVCCTACSASARGLGQRAARPTARAARGPRWTHTRLGEWHDHETAQ